MTLSPPPVRTADPTRAERYYPVTGLRLHAVSDSPHLVATLPGGRSFRLGRDLGPLLDEVAARPGRGAADLAATLGPGWDATLVDTVLRDLRERGLVRHADDPAPPAPREGLVTFAPPLTVQLTLWREGQGGRAVENLLLLLGRATGRAGAVVALTLGAAGAIPLVRGLASGAGALHQGVRLPAYLALLVLTGVCVAVHELAHAAACRHRGLMPRRIGVMIFYLSPAAFCDVSTAWRLTRRDRVAVALAGIITNLAMAGACALAAPALPGAAAQVAVILAVTNYSLAAVNLIPFVKLDGYLALMSWLDVPRLRERCIEAFGDDVRAWLARGERAGRHADEPSPAWWRVFGLAALVLPLLIVTAVATSLAPSLLAFGVVGAATNLLLVAALLYIVARPGATQLRRAWAERSGGLAFAVRGTGLALLVGVALGTPMITESDTLGYVRSGEGIVLVAAPGAGQAPVTAPPGSRWTLHRAGVLRGEVVGAVTAAPGASPCEAPLSALAPQLDAPATNVPAVCVPVAPTGAVAATALAIPGPEAPPTGVAVGESRRTSPAAWAYHRIVHPSLSLILRGLS